MLKIMNKMIALALVMANLLTTSVVFADSSLSPAPVNNLSITPSDNAPRGEAPRVEDGGNHDIILPVISPELIPDEPQGPASPIGEEPSSNVYPPKPPKDNGNGGTDNPPTTDNPDNNTGGGGGGGGGKKVKKPLTIADMSPELRNQLLNLLRAILALQAAQYPFVSGYTAPVIPEIKG